MSACVVCLKIVPDTSQLGIDPRTGGPRLDGAALRISTFDEHALEEAVRLRERTGGRIVLLSLLPAEPPRELLLRALAMGADEARLVLDPTAASADALATARVLAAAIRAIDREPLVLCGEGSLDAYSRQVAPRLAEELGIPVLTRVVRIEATAAGLTVDRDREECTETFEAARPLVLSVGQEINRPRLPTVVQILGASRKPIARLTLRDLGFNEDQTCASLSGVRTLGYRAPSHRRLRADVSGDTVEEMAERLARDLFEKGLVILR